MTFYSDVFITRGHSFQISNRVYIHILSKVPNPDSDLTDIMRFLQLRSRQIYWCLFKGFTRLLVLSCSRVHVAQDIKSWTVLNAEEADEQNHVQIFSPN